MAYRSKQMLIVRRDLKMRKGKIAAQASHASVEAVLKAIVKENRAGQLRTDPEGYAYLDAPEGQGESAHRLVPLRHGKDLCLCGF